MHDNGYKQHDRCSKCKAHRADEKHLFWECEALAVDPDIRVHRANNLTSRAADEWQHNSVFWGRGLLPKSMIKLTAPFELPTARQDVFLGQAFSLDEHEEYAADGAGGEDAGDELRRRCGWYWSQVGYDTPEGQSHGQVADYQASAKLSQGQSSMRYVWSSREPLPRN